MNDTKLLKMALLAIGLVGIVLIVMPQTISLFAGQHSWYDLSGSPRNVECDKCHEDISGEMGSSTGPHTELSSLMYCEDCHRIFYNYSGNNYPKYEYASGIGTGSTPGEEAHATSTIECLDCHGLLGDAAHTITSTYPWGYAHPCDRCHFSWGPGFGFIAGGFNLTKRAGSTNSWDYEPSVDDTGNKSTHRQFVLDAIDDPLMEGANEACIGCHTSADVNLTYQLPNRYEVNITKNCDWTVNIGYGNFTEVRN